MSLTYQRYLSVLNIETPREYNDWGQHYDMETQMLINVITPLKHPILNQINKINQLKQVNQINQLKQVNQIKNLKQINSQPPIIDIDIESGLKHVLENYTAKQSNKDHCKCDCKSAFITSVIYMSHLVLFIMLFK
jgi:hypothetical protein